tara:strand:+ start:435 stop:728 length:294 start_codon:yes stop_codon:yes gene_type:complete
VFAVVELDPFHLLGYLGVVLQYHNVTWHEPLVEELRHADSLLCGELLGSGYYANHVLAVEVSVPDQLVDGPPVSGASELNELNLLVHHGLAGEWTWW